MLYSIASRRLEGYKSSVDEMPTQPGSWTLTRHSTVLIDSLERGIIGSIIRRWNATDVMVGLLGLSIVGTVAYVLAQGVSTS